jgi:hypothetical protein
MTETALVVAFLLVLATQYGTVVSVHRDARSRGTDDRIDYAWPAIYLPFVGFVVILAFFYDQEKVRPTVRASDSQGEDEDH